MRHSLNRLLKPGSQMPKRRYATHTYDLRSIVSLAHQLNKLMAVHYRHPKIGENEANRSGEERRRATPSTPLAAFTTMCPLSGASLQSKLGAFHHHRLLVWLPFFGLLAWKSMKIHTDRERATKSIPKATL